MISQTRKRFLLLILLYNIGLVICDGGGSDELNNLNEFIDIQVRHSRSSDHLGEYYDLSYRAFDEDFNVRLRRSADHVEDTSVYGKNFKVTTLDMDPQGRTLFADETPSLNQTKDIENNIYVDPRTDTAVHLNKDKDGKMQINGIIQGRTIIPLKKAGSKPDAPADHQLVNAKIPKLPDYIDEHRKTKPLKGRTLFQGIPYIEPEVFVVLDYDNSMLHKMDVKEIMKYLTVLFKSVNNRFATLKQTMKINFKISGLITVKSYNAQPFIQNWSVLNGKGFDIVKVLDDFSRWLYAYQQKVPPHDLAALITGKNMYTLDKSGRYSDGVTGYAFVKGACWVNHFEKKYMGTSVTEDIGGYWYGVFSVAHEFAHNLGAPHDGQPGGGRFNEPSTASCTWKQGYMMSYEGWGSKNKFFFSPCSATLMKNFLVTDGAKCMKFQHAKSQWKESNLDVGDKLSMKQMCIKYTKNANAYVDPSKTPGDLCKNLVCRTPGAKKGSYSWVALNHAPGDNVPCSKGKRCQNGDCVDVKAAKA